MKPIEPPYIKKDIRHAFNYYTIKIKNEKRDELKEYLTQNEISNGIYYPLSLHLQEVYKKYGYKKGDAPVSETIQDEIISLPLFPELTEDEITYITDKIKSFFD